MPSPEADASLQGLQGMSTTVLQNPGVQQKFHRSAAGVWSTAAENGQKSLLGLQLCFRTTVGSNELIAPPPFPPAES